MMNVAFYSPVRCHGATPAPSSWGSVLDFQTLADLRVVIQKKKDGNGKG